MKYLAYMLLPLSILSSSCGGGRSEADLLRGFEINSSDSLWSPRLQEFNKSRAPLHYLTLGDDSISVEFDINEKRKFGRLRSIDIVIRGDRPKDNDCPKGTGAIRLPILPDYAVTKRSVQGVISLLKEIYGNPKNVKDYADGPSILSWAQPHYSVKFQSNKFIYDSCYNDSITYTARIEIRSNEYDRLLSEDLKKYRLKHRLTEIVKVGLQPPKFEIVSGAYNSSVNLIQTYYEIAHLGYGYDENVSSIKFDVEYKSKFQERVLIVRNVTYNFSEGLEPNKAILPYGIGFKIKLSSDEVQNCRPYFETTNSWLRAEAINLKILFSNGEVFN